MQAHRAQKAGFAGGIQGTAVVSKGYEKLLRGNPNRGIYPAPPRLYGLYSFHGCLRNRKRFCELVCKPDCGAHSLHLRVCAAFFEFLMYKEFDDFLFPKQTSHNMIAVRKPKGEVKQRIVMVGHSDSQFEWTLNYLIGGLQAKLFVEIPAVVGLIVQTVFALVCIIAGKGGAAVNIQSARWFFILFFVISCVFIPFEFAFLFFQSWTKSVPGASDNLSGCYVGMAVVKALDEAKVRFENTEVVVICSGSEEAGLRGSKAYAKAHEKSLKKSQPALWRLTPSAIWKPWLFIIAISQAPCSITTALRFWCTMPAQTADLMLNMNLFT